MPPADRQRITAFCDDWLAGTADHARLARIEPKDDPVGFARLKVNALKSARRQQRFRIDVRELQIELRLAFRSLSQCEPFRGLGSQSWETTHLNSRSVLLREADAPHQVLKARIGT